MKVTIHPPHLYTGFVLSWKGGNQYWDLPLTSLRPGSALKLSEIMKCVIWLLCVFASAFSIFLAPQPAGRLTGVMFVAVIHRDSRIWNFSVNCNVCSSRPNPQMYKVGSQKGSPSLWNCHAHLSKKGSCKPKAIIKILRTRNCLQAPESSLPPPVKAPTVM